MQERSLLLLQQIFMLMQYVIVRFAPKQAETVERELFLPSVWSEPVDVRAAAIKAVVKSERSRYFARGSLPVTHKDDLQLWHCEAELIRPEATSVSDFTNPPRSRDWRDPSCIEWTWQVQFVWV